MKKKLTIVAVSVLAAMAIFGAGLALGLNSWRFIFPDYSDLSKAYADIASVQINIEQLDRGDNNALRGSLILELDGAVIKTYQLLKESDNAEQISKASKWLKRVAKHRKDHPPTYPPSVQNAEFDKTKNYVASILVEFEEGI